MKRIGIFGGTFNPPHFGHITAARACVDQLRLNRLLMIPTRVPPHKPLPPGSPSPGQRLEMTAIAASMVPMAEASDIEIRRSGPSYTSITAGDVSSLYPGCDLWLVIGTDMLETFDRWHDTDEILSLCRLAAVARGKNDMKRIENKARELRQRLGARVDIVLNPVVEASSTEFRELGRFDIIPSEIKRYIAMRHLYEGENNG